MALSGAMGRGIQWHRAVYFAQWSTGGQNLIKIWLRGDSNPRPRENCFNGMGAMRYNTGAQYATYSAMSTVGENAKIAKPNAAMSGKAGSGEYKTIVIKQS